MAYLQPTTWEAAVDARAAHPEAVPVAGGTDVLVDVNFGRLQPEAILDITRVAGLRGWERHDGTLRIGAAVTYRDIIAELHGSTPALAAAARTVGSAQIRNRGTIGGNLGSASPAGDCHPVLLAVDAEVEIGSVRGSRRLPISEFFVGPKRNVLAADELVRAVLLPVADGPQSFVKVGPRQAMVIAVCSFALALHPRRRHVGTGIGSAGPTPLRAPSAERYIDDLLERSEAWQSRRPLDRRVIDDFADMVSDAATPIDDVRGTAVYRRHALGVVARRSLAACWEAYRREAA